MQYVRNIRLLLSTREVNMTGYRRFFFCFVLFLVLLFICFFFTFTEQENVKEQTEAEITRLDP